LSRRLLSSLLRFAHRRYTGHIGKLLQLIRERGRTGDAEAKAFTSMYSKSAPAAASKDFDTDGKPIISAPM
jgi:hypothetical protein